MARSDVPAPRMAARRSLGRRGRHSGRPRPARGSRPMAVPLTPVAPIARPVTAPRLSPSSGPLHAERPGVRRPGRLLLHRLPGRLHRPEGGRPYVSPGFGTIAPVLQRLAMAMATASRSARTARSCGPRSSAGTSCTGSSWRTRPRPRRSARPSPATLPARRRIRCAPTRTATSTWRSTAGPGAGVQQERHPHRPGAAAGPGGGPPPALHQHGDRARPDDLYIVTNDGNGGQGATIFRARALADALPLYSHR